MNACERTERPLATKKGETARTSVPNHAACFPAGCLIQMKVGLQPQAAILRSIELLGTVVAPKVRAAIGKPG